MWSAFCDVFDNPENLIKEVEGQLTLDYDFFEEECKDK